MRKNNITKFRKLQLMKKTWILFTVFVITGMFFSSNAQSFTPPINTTRSDTFSTHWSGTELNDLQSYNTIATAGTFHANLIWFPSKLISTGNEYMWGAREDKNGIRGTASRLQFMVKFKFN